MNPILQQIILVIVAGIFGALITYFFKSLQDGKTVKNLISTFEDTIKDSIKEAFNIHVKIHHSNKPEEIVEKEITKYSLEVEHKLSERDQKIELLAKDTGKKIEELKTISQGVQKTLKKIELHLMKIILNIDKDSAEKLIDDLRGNP